MADSKAEERAELKARLLDDAMADYRRALPYRGFRKGDQKVFRRWLDPIFCRRTGQPILDDSGAILRRFGPPLAWFDSITKRGAWPRGMAADLDFFLERNGLFLVMEFKSAHGERRLDAGADKLGAGQWRSLATLAKSGLFVVYAVEYSDAGSNDAPPTITRIRRLTDDVAPAKKRWKRADFGDLLCLVHEWWTNSADTKFVRRQKAAACYSQILQHMLSIAPYSVSDREESILERRIQHEALRLAAREERAGAGDGTFDGFRRRFLRHVELLSTGLSDDRSTA